MGVEIAEFFARGAFGRTTHVPRLDLTGPEESVASRAFLGGHAHAFNFLGAVSFLSVGGGECAVIGQTLFPEEEPMTTAAWMIERLPGTIVLTPGLETGGTFLAFAGVVPVVIVIETRLAPDAKLILPQETWERVTSVVVLAHFDEHDLFVLGGPLKIIWYR